MHYVRGISGNIPNITETYCRKKKCISHIIDRNDAKVLNNTVGELKKGLRTTGHYVTMHGNMCLIKYGTNLCG